MAEYSVSVEANRPIDHAWAVLVDDSRMGEWLQGYKSTETLEGEPLTVGSKHRVVFDEGGMEVVFIETVRVVDAPTEFSFDLKHEMMGSSIRFLLESIGPDRTQISCVTTVNPSEMVTEEQLEATKPDMKDRQMRNFNSLKAVIEAS